MKVAENHLRDVDFSPCCESRREWTFRCFRRLSSVCAVYHYLEVGHGRLTLLLIGRVDNDLVKDLVETRDEGYLLLLHLPVDLLKVHMSSCSVRSTEPI